ncbi:MAG: Phage tail tube protein [Verrucomicrobiota bacterium]
MAVPYRSLGSSAGLGLEVTPGTPVSRTRWVHLNGSSLTQTARNRATRGRLAHTSAAFVESRFVVDQQVGGTLTVPGSYSALGLLLRAALGTVAGVGPYTFSAAAALPSLTIEQIVGSSGSSEVYAGCKVNSMTLTATPGAEVTFAFDLIGISKAVAGSAGTPTLTSAVAIEHYEWAVTWAGSSVGTVKSLSSVLSNNLNRRPQVGSLRTAEPSVGVREVRTTIVVDKESFAARASEIADTTGDLVLTATDTASGAKTFVYTINDCTLRVTETLGDSIADLTTSLEFESIGNPEIVVTNGEATYDV